MLFLHASIENQESGNQETLQSIPFKHFQELRPSEPFERNDGYGIIKHPLLLPNSEEIYLSAAFWEHSSSLSFLIENGKDALLDIWVFKPNPASFDPSLVFRTPEGINVSFMFSSKGH